MTWNLPFIITASFSLPFGSSPEVFLQSCVGGVFCWFGVFGFFFNCFFFPCSFSFVFSFFLSFFLQTQKRIHFCSITLRIPVFTDTSCCHCKLGMPSRKKTFKIYGKKEEEEIFLLLLIVTFRGCLWMHEQMSGTSSWDQAMKQKSCWNSRKWRRDGLLLLLAVQVKKKLTLLPGKFNKA